MSTKHATLTTSLKRKIENVQSTCGANAITLQTLANEIDNMTTSLEKKPR